MRGVRFKPRSPDAVAAGFLFFAFATASYAQPLDLPNHSFELPDASAPHWEGLPAVPWIDDWMRSGPSYEDPVFDQSGLLDTGVFTNPPEDSPMHLAGVDGQQMAFIAARDPANIPSGESSIAIHQTLGHNYQQGKHYVLTIGVAPASDLMYPSAPRAYNPNNPDPDAPPAELTFRLYYEHDQQRLTVASATVLSTQVQQNVMIDFELISTTVDASDPWLGQPIGIEIAPTLGLSGYWNLDNVRLTQVPEPATATLVGLAGLALLRRRRQ
ncbi:MAG: PEP-CTERM sorting domain-containing protein [Phycisphaeraceae bacterium]|nr:PEP-CTERM sorting domain-containing protein [Phycisphaeraceae bacterium]